MLPSSCTIGPGCNYMYSNTNATLWCFVERTIACVPCNCKCLVPTATTKSSTQLQLCIVLSGRENCMFDTNHATASIASLCNYVLFCEGVGECGVACMQPGTQLWLSCPICNCMSCNPTATGLFCSVGGGGPVASPTTAPQLQVPPPTATACPPTCLQLDFLFCQRGCWERGRASVHVWH